MTTALARVVIDTDVASYLFRGDSRAAAFRPYLADKVRAMAFMSVAEQYYGAYWRGWGAKRLAELEAFLRNFVILPYDYEVSRTWARIKADCDREGNPVGHADLWIAAIALAYDCPVVTNNRRHFEHVKGLTVISP